MQEVEQDARKILDICIQAKGITSQLLKLAIMDYLDGKTEKQGRMSLGSLAEKGHGKLESIEITQKNIGDFLNTAKKYNIDFALKRDKSVDPPLYHVFFATDKTDNFKRAFTEYADIVHGKSEKKEASVTREQINKIAAAIGKEAVKGKQRVRQKNKSRNRAR